MSGRAQEQKGKSLSAELDSVIISGFSINKRLMEAPSAISLVRSTDLNRTAGLSLVAAFNTAPGVRMEERSPGSYRLSVRGSLLRSPFGVRNVKIYWDDIPLTDASGNTYLNLIAPSAINSAEIIKGPGASLYGAGTGGVVLFHTSEFDPCLNLQRDYITPDSAENQINDQFSKLNKISSAASVKFGSYGLWSVDALAQIIGKGKNETQQRDKSGQPINLRLSATGYDGYRRHSEMKRKTIQLDGTIHVGRKSVWKGLFTYVDLFYQTPGGLTAAQYEEDPKQARPATAQAPGAAEQNASITNRTVFAGTGRE